MSDYDVVRDRLTDLFVPSAGMKPPPSVARAFAALDRIQAHEAEQAATIERLTQERDRLQRFINNQTPGQCADCPGGKSWEDEAAALRAENQRLRNVEWDCPHCHERVHSIVRGSAALSGSTGDEQGEAG